PVLVDVLDDFTMDPDAVKRVLNNRTKAIIPVDIGGLPANLKAIMRVAEEGCSLFTPKVNLRVAGSNPQMRLGRVLVLSDAAHSFGAQVGSKKVGAQADITGFSFHAVKNLTTAEGGALAFNLPEPFDHEELYKYFNTMSLHGQGCPGQDPTRRMALRCGLSRLEMQHDRYPSCHRYGRARTVRDGDHPAPKGHLRAVFRGFRGR
ncbi:MAG TPA: DegT/DnrJ/EryC1/StrS family aminotransferase, partial [Flavobacteriales bacterium]|nr:DegT/DnrJ/EryC1/StrS family aminotransferase [Flavobacteriales bacterium]